MSTQNIYRKGGIKGDGGIGWFGALRVDLVTLWREEGSGGKRRFGER